ncbi:MAG: hypothetical protein JRN12_07330 [Nitrososphaerota archaeon]|nr:hypothetical protein [Nitrososphaerota archaeon]MDG6951635.1 hypothetical protein [Nitrososphaerota archaeon]
MSAAGDDRSAGHMPPRAKRVLASVLALDAALLVLGPVAGAAAGSASASDAVNAYLDGGGALSADAVVSFASAAFVIASVIAVALYMDSSARGAGACGRNVSRGSWWLLLTIPALVGNYFDFFVGHIVFSLVFVALAYLFYTGSTRAWKLGAVLGTFIAVFYAADGSGDLVRGGPWNVTAVTLSSPAVTHTVWGLLAFMSDMTVAVILLPLVYSVSLSSRRPLAAILGVSFFLACVPRLLLLPVLGFDAVFSGWASYIGNAGNAIALAAIPVAWRAKPPER